MSSKSGLQGQPRARASASKGKAAAAGNDIAIVGRACRLPGAPDIDALWDLLIGERCSVTNIPADRWSKESLLHPRIADRGHTYTFAAGVLDDVWGFDPAAFGISPREAEMMDPQQRLLLELVWEAIDDAGIPQGTLAGSDAGVFVGVSGVDHSTLRMLDMSSADAYMMTGNTMSVVANRISYVFDLHGPSFIIDTACSSALVALNEAITNLRSGRIETAIVAGVGLLLTPHSFVGFSQAAMLSRRGLCQAFSAAADGYVRAEGGAVLVLKTEAAARRDGNAVHSFIVASDVNSDGRTNGISLPSLAMQETLLHRVYGSHNIEADDLAFFEAHGTGTPVGDPIEARAIGESLASRRSRPLPIGSVKSNIGHMEAASGLGGLLKASLALEHDLLPATLHADELNPNIDFAALNLDVAQTPRPLARQDDRRRFAGVNSFGFGGTNAHVVLTDGTAPVDHGIVAPPPFLVLSAHSRPALDAVAARFAERLRASRYDDGNAAMAAAVHRRDLLSHRLVMPTGADAGPIADRLAAASSEADQTGGVVRGVAVQAEAPVAFVFSGNGSQFAGMGIEAYRQNRAFRARFDNISALFEDMAGWSLADALLDPEVGTKLRLTEFAQPLLFAVQAATSHALRESGLEPACVFGHSVGEVAAAETAGALDLDDALRTIYARSLSQRPTRGTGGMAVLIGAPEALDRALSLLPSLALAAKNSPRAFTLSGPLDEIERLSDVVRPFGARIRRLELDYPFHSPLMAAVEEPLLRSLDGLVARASAIPFVSTVTGTVLDGREVGAHYWWRNVREPVAFSDAVAEAARIGTRIFVEIGPNPTLLSHINDCLDTRRAACAALPSLEKRSKGDPIITTVATALARGAAVNRDRVFGPAPAPGSRIALPLYPWQRSPFRLAETADNLANFRPSQWHPLIGSRVDAERAEWRSVLDTVATPSLADHRVDGRVILPGAAFAEMALAVARQWFKSDKAGVAELEITVPLQLASDNARDVQCRVSPATGQLEIASRPRLSPTTWQVHATAKLVRDAASMSPSIVDGEPDGQFEIAGEDIYKLADAAGLVYGPTYRLLSCAKLVATNSLDVSLIESETMAGTGVDPARLDACFHALAVVFAQQLKGSAAFVPVRFGEIALLQPGVAFSRARITITRCDERAAVADMTMLDDRGAVVLALRDARFQLLRGVQAAGAAKRFVQQRYVLATRPTAGGDHGILEPIALDGAPKASQAGASMAEQYVLLDGWATSLAYEFALALADHGLFDPAALIAAGRIDPRLDGWVGKILKALQRSGLATEADNGAYRILSVDLPPQDDILRTIVLEHRSLAAEVLIAAATSIAVKEVAAGAAMPGKRALSDKLVDGFELGSYFAQSAADHIVERLERASDSLPAHRGLRILQLGAGPLGPRLLRWASTRDGRLTIFDPSQRRLEKARATLGNEVKYVDALDHLPANGFDLVVSANALHRLRALESFAVSLRRAMAGSAVLLAVEPVASFFGEFVFGLAAAHDGGAATKLAWVPTRAEWLASSRGFGLSAFAAEEIQTQAGTAVLMTGHVAAEGRSWSADGSALVISATGSGSASALVSLLATSGLHVNLMTGDAVGEQTIAAVDTIVLLASDREGGGEPARVIAAACLLMKRLLAVLEQRPAQLWVVVDAPDAGAEGRDGVGQAICAFARTLANEAPFLQVRRVEVADGLTDALLSERLRELILSGTDETEIRLEASRTSVLRFSTMTHYHADDAAPAEAARLERADTIGAGRLSWQPSERQAPGPGEVEIAVEAAGLNFRDVMFGLGLLPEEILERGFAGPTIGLELAGRVARVGRGIRNLKPGDRVAGFGKHALATHVVTAGALVAPLGEFFSFEEGATIPVAFMTAFYGLIDCARLKADEWVLIHGGAGGVGLAAIQIARWRGARIIATAGTPERRALLTALGAEHAFDSRSGAFVEDVRHVARDGVGVVLNSLAGEAMERTLGLLRPLGRFVELGKRDYVGNTHIGLRPFRRNLSYFGVDLDQLLMDDPAAGRLLLRRVMDLFASGDLTPLPFRVFDPDEVLDAFRTMQQSGHLGKLVVRPPQAVAPRPASERRFAADPDRAHLVTGGFGGFGLATARWLARNGARHLVLLGREGAKSDEARAAVADLERDGVIVHGLAVDVADPSAMTALFARFGNDLPPLAGVVHAAMVLSDGLITNLSPDAMDAVLRPKVAGADLLDKLTAGHALDYFVLYSSATTIVGNPGQAAYVAANGYLEGLARARLARRQPALAVAWGAIEDVGVLARNKEHADLLVNRIGIKSMHSDQALECLGEVLAAGGTDAVVAIAPMSWSAARKHLAVMQSPTFAAFAAEDDEGAGEVEKIDIAKMVASRSAEETRQTIATMIADEVSRVLHLPRDEVTLTAPLADVGLDSLMAVELALGLEARFALNGQLSATASSFSIGELADHLIALASGNVTDEALALQVAQRHLGSADMAALTRDADDFREAVAQVNASSREIRSLLH